MNKNIFILLLAILLAGCSNIPQTLDDVMSEYVTVNDGVSVHYKVWNKTSDMEAKTICFIHGFG